MNRQQKWHRDNLKREKNRFEVQKRDYKIQAFRNRWKYFCSKRGFQKKLLRNGAFCSYMFPRVLKAFPFKEFTFKTLKNIVQKH